jgi:glycosyltransferase involved in cell wall biosynthesis
MRRYNIILLTKNYKDYASGYYHHDLNMAFKSMHNTFLYGPGYPNYNKNDSIKDVIRKSSFNPDLIVVGTSWELQDPNNPDFDIHPKLNLAEAKIPKVMFLNKEYKKLEQKLDYIKKSNINLVSTVLNKYKEWEKETGTHFIQLPFGVSLERFKPLNIHRKYDFGFAGALHEKHTDMRLKVKKLLFKKNRLKNSYLNNIINPFKRRYSNFKIYWGEWGSKDLFFRTKTPSGRKYVGLLNKCKTFLSTKSAEGIIGTRFFELGAVKTMIICPKDNYDGIFKDKINCVIFEQDLNDFKEKLTYYVNNPDERSRITEKAFNDIVNKHTWENRLKRLFSKLYKLNIIHK